jgi:hypothetical protein
MTLFKISFVTTGGKKWDYDTCEADLIKETSTGYALVKDMAIVYTIPAGLIVEIMNREE